jgi:carboxymethylenebutenolidase
MVDVKTSDGLMNSYIYHPDEGGPHPLILFLMDSGGVREPLADLCRRLASVGYFVVMPNLYYRDVRWLDIEVDRLGDPAYGEKLELMWRLHHTLTNTLVMDDIRHLIAHLESEPMANTGAIGTVGYCMSGRYAFRAAGEFSDRIRAAACMYGVRYFTDEADSAHFVAPRITGEVYIGMAEHDPYVSPDTAPMLQRLCAEQHFRHRIEIYPAVEHGFALPGRRVYHKASAERHWERLIALFRRNLG